MCGLVGYKSFDGSTIGYDVLACMTDSLTHRGPDDMTYSIENRLPFLDYRLAEFCSKLDNRLKIRNGIGSIF